MNFEQLLASVGDEPLFETSLLLAGEVNPDYLRVQLTRWKNAGRIIQLRRGLYALAPPYRKVRPHPFLIANRLRGASYVSLQSALTFKRPPNPQRDRRTPRTLGNSVGRLPLPSSQARFAVRLSDDRARRRAASPGRRA